MDSLTSKKDTYRLFEKCHDYLFHNFHKFNQKDQIKIATEIVKKYIPQTLEHSGKMEFEGDVNIIERYKKFHETFIQENIGNRM